MRLSNQNVIVIHQIIVERLESVHYDEPLAIVLEQLYFLSLQSQWRSQIILFEEVLDISDIIDEM